MDFLPEWKKCDFYFETLQFLAGLSGLFSDNDVPYLDYRLTENVFCHFYKAINDARSCTAYDARIEKLGIGIKTFILKNGQSTEKIAEFNRLKKELDPLKGIDLARKLAEFRNRRIDIADNMYGTTQCLYHIIGREPGKLIIFNTKYDRIVPDDISITKNNASSLAFTDGINEYFFNRSKSVLIKRFLVNSKDCKEISVNIFSEPLKELERFIRCIKNNQQGLCKLDIPVAGVIQTPPKRPGVDYVILPLYSTRRDEPFVPERSGLNQWNAGGRKRDPNEVYIPVPKKIHQKCPDFFPGRNEYFVLELPDKSVLSVKLCQENSKALMSTHNADLGYWLLRKVLQLPEGHVVTIEDLNRFGIDSVRIENRHCLNSEGSKVYAITFTSSGYEKYSDFMVDEE